MGFSSVPLVIKFRSAVIIQKWFRRFKCRLEARRKLAWVVHQSIEYSVEASQNQLRRFFNEILTNNAKAANKEEGSSEAASTYQPLTFYERLQKLGDRNERKLAMSVNLEEILVATDYSGPRLTFPLSPVQVHEMINKFKAGHQLHPRYLLQLLRETLLFLKTKPNISKASTTISKQMTVVGDLHGQLEDLLIIFYKNGLPDVTNPYVFNGDYVDRGAHSVEVAAILFACLLVWPTGVHLNRGNHEDYLLNERYGFLPEIQAKYRRFGCENRVMRMFSEVFAWLPLATIIDSRILVTHGGISDTLDLKLVEKVKRQSYESIDYLLINPSKVVNEKELEQIVQLMWNDPHSVPGCASNQHKRGVGLCFGPDVTAKFLSLHGLSMLVRSHECKEHGFEYAHNKKLLTIFSASNYCSAGNYGAYVKFDEKGEASLVKFTVTVNALLSCHQQTSKVEESALQALRTRISASKAKLTEAFLRVESAAGKVTVDEWCQVMSATLKLNLPWRLLLPHLVQKTQAGHVLFQTAFEHVTIKHGLIESSTVTEILYQNRSDLEEIFRIMDKDNSGYISLDEFKDCCRVLGQTTRHKFSDKEVAAMAKAIDLKADGKIDYNEFLESFRIVNCQSQPQPQPQPQRQKRSPKQQQQQQSPKENAVSKMKRT